MAQTTFFEVIVRLDETHCGKFVTEATMLQKAISIVELGYVVGARVASGPATEMAIDEVEPFARANKFDVMIARRSGLNRIDYAVSRNIKADSAAVACLLSSSVNTTPVGVRMVGGPVGPFTFKGREL